MNTQNNQTATNESTARKKLYAVKTRYSDIGKITEYVVIRETPKTYVAAPADDPSGRWGQRTIKKADPQVYDDYFCVGYHEALLYKKKVLEGRIAHNKSNIEQMLAANIRYNAMIGNTLAEIALLSEGKQ